MFDLNSFMLFSDNPKKLSDFYAKVFQNKPMWEEGDFYGYQVGNGQIAIGKSDKVKGKNKNPERMFFNLITSDVQKEFDRVKSLGAEVVAKPYHPMEANDMLIATFSDPDGNFFQLMSPMK